MKFVFAIAILGALLATNQISTSNVVAAPEQCLDIYTKTWGGCAAINAGLPQTSGTGGGSKGLYVMVRATL
ncbi:MAG: hypothetical protein RIQ88_682 [Actinomycetota bacterium]|jgi:hypothetical protein